MVRAPIAARVIKGPREKAPNTSCTFHSSAKVSAASVSHQRGTIGITLLDDAVAVIDVMNLGSQGVAARWSERCAWSDWRLGGSLILLPDAQPAQAVIDEHRFVSEDGVLRIDQPVLVVIGEQRSIACGIHLLVGHVSVGVIVV